MPRIDQRWVDQFLILDGGSTDGPKEYLLSMGYDVIDQTTIGIKAAFWEAFEQLETSSFLFHRMEILSLKTYLD